MLSRKHLCSKLYYLKTNNFALSIRDKEKRLSQFFKLPQHQFSPEVYDRDQMQNDSVLNTFSDEQNLDKLDMMDKILQKKKQESESKVSKFFANVSGREAIKISENLIEKLRLKKEFKFNEDFKQK